MYIILQTHIFYRIFVAATIFPLSSSFFFIFIFPLSLHPFIQQYRTIPTILVNDGVSRVCNFCSSFKCNNSYRHNEISIGGVTFLLLFDMTIIEHLCNIYINNNKSRKIWEMKVWNKSVFTFGSSRERGTRARTKKNHNGNFAKLILTKNLVKTMTKEHR